MRILFASASALLLVSLAGAPALAETASLSRASVATLERWDCPSRCPHLDVEAYWRIGPSNGFLQTPRGGQPGTTSPRRPGLDELGLGTTTELGLAAATTWLRHELVFRGDITLLGGTSTLHRDLVSQAEPFPVGTIVDAQSFLGTYRLGYRYRLDVGVGGRQRLVVKPGLGVTMLQVAYEMDGSNFRGTDRKYRHAGPHVDLNLSWRPGGTSPWVVEAEASQTLAFLLGDGNQLDVFEARLRVRYELIRCWSLFFETGYRMTDWRDDQEVPNHIHVEYGPWFGFGVGHRF